MKNSLPTSVYVNLKAGFHRHVTKKSNMIQLLLIVSRDQQRKSITICQGQFPLLEFTCLVSRLDFPFFFSS